MCDAYARTMKNCNSNAFNSMKPTDVTSKFRINFSICTKTEHTPIAI